MATLSQRSMFLVMATAFVTWALADCLSEAASCHAKGKDDVLIQLRQTLKAHTEAHVQDKAYADVHMVMPWSQGCIIGGGFDFEHGCTYPQAMEYIPPCDSLSTAARGVACTQDRMADKVTSYTRDVRTSSDYSSLLDTTTSAEAGGWGISVSTSVGVLTTSAWSTSSMSFVLGGSGETKTTSVQHPVSLRLNEAAAALLKKDPVGFLDRYSPYYVHSIVHGGSFLGSVTLNSKKTSSTDAFSFGFGFSVNLGFFSVGASHEFTTEVEKSWEDVEMTLTADWLGGTGVHFSSNATPASLGESHEQWSKSWRENPHELKIVLRRWIDIEEVQLILNDHPREIRELFNQDTLKPTIQAMLTKENAEISLLKNSLKRALDWEELRRNRTVQDQWDDLNFEVMRHSLALEHLDHIGVLQRQSEVLNGDRSWFSAKRLTRKFEDMRLALGRHCDDGHRVVDGICEPWGGNCENGELLPVWDRTADNECGSCDPGHVLLEQSCVKFKLHDKVTSEERHDGHGYDGTSSTYIAHHSDGYICALQEAAVEDLGTDYWSKASCKVYPEHGRMKMDARARGAWTDARCSSSCIETDYPVTEHYYVDRNRERHERASGVSSKTMISTVGSVCWLSMVSFWQITHENEFAECSIKANAESMWELHASLKGDESHLGAECGAVCLHNLPLATFSIEEEVIKHWDRSDCVETDLGSSENRHCFLSSMAVSHAWDWQERPRCDLKIKEAETVQVEHTSDETVEKIEDVDESRKDQQRWILRTCNGERRHAEAMCGARCITFA